MIRKEHGKFVLRASSGLALGRHTTKAGAQRQETAINLAKARAAGHHVPRASAKQRRR
jgi:hypothetical protein